MNSSKTTGMIVTMTALILLFIVPIQSISTAHKRWTFNTWRLHGPRYTPQTSIHSTTEPYSSTASPDVNEHDSLLHLDNDEQLKLLLQLLQLFETLNREENGNNQV